MFLLGNFITLTVLVFACEKSSYSWNCDLQWQMVVSYGWAELNAPQVNFGCLTLILIQQFSMLMLLGIKLFWYNKACQQSERPGEFPANCLLGKVTCTLEGAAETAGDDAGFMNAASALSEDLSHRRKTWQPAVCCIVITGEVGTTEKDIVVKYQSFIVRKLLYVVTHQIGQQFLVSPFCLNRKQKIAAA